MSKLGKIVNKLSESEYNTIYHNLVDALSYKSADLLKLLRDEGVENDSVREQLGISKNAYYTLRSRLNERIESYFVEELEGSKSNLFRQVANINDLVLSKNRVIAIATLKKMEKELLNFELFSELSQVYRALKKLHLNTDSYFEYSQLYNKHSALLLANEKLEGLTAEYFKAYNLNVLAMQATESLESQVIRKEIESINNIYGSNRLEVLQSLVVLFNKITSTKNKKVSFEEELKNIETNIGNYRNDATYKHLKWVVRYLFLLDAFRNKDYQAVSKEITQLDTIAPQLITNYNLFTGSALYLIIKLELAAHKGTLSKLEKENEVVFKSFELDTGYQLSFVVYCYYRGVSCFYAEKYSKAKEWLLLACEDTTIKDYPKMMVDLKLFLATIHLMLLEFEEATNVINYVQRIIRINDKSNFEYSNQYMRILKASLSTIDIDKKERKLLNQKELFEKMEKPFQSPLRMVNIDVIPTTEILEKRENVRN